MTMLSDRRVNVCLRIRPDLLDSSHAERNGEE